LDEGVVADAQGVPDLAELPGHVVAVRLHVLAQLRGALRHLDGVLVVAHQEEDLVALHAAVAGLHVGAELLKRGADVRPNVGIVDRRCLEETRFVGNDGNPPFLGKTAYRAFYSPFLRGGPPGATGSPPPPAPPAA